MANLVDELLRVNPDKLEELQTTTYKSHRLARLLGWEEPVEVTLQELPPDRLTYLSSLATDRNGDVEQSKTMEAAYTIVAESCISPDLTDKELKAHFNVDLPVDLARKLFGLECSTMTKMITDLSMPDDEEDTIKN